MCNEDDPAKLTVAQLGGNVHVESEEEEKKKRLCSEQQQIVT